MKLAAIVHASHAPRWQRWGWYGLATAFFGFGTLLLNTFPIAPTLLVIAAVLFLLSPFVLHRGPYRAAIETGPGELLVRPRFGAPFRIPTRSLVGASGALDGDAPIVTLAQPNRVQHTFVLEPGASTDDIRRVLGIPSGGFGELRWKYAPTPIELVTLVSRILSVPIVVAYALDSSALGSTAWAFAFGLLGATAIFLVLDALSGGRQLVMNAAGISWTEGRTPPYVEYAEIGSIDDDGRAITIHASGQRDFAVPCAATRLATGLRAGERRALVAQLQNAVRRSKGKIRVDDLAIYAEDLARGFDSTAEWLARIDGMAAATSNAPAGYRGGAVPIAALWKILEDHDSVPAARAAAARILTRALGDKATMRVDEAIASIHDPNARALVRTVREDDARQVLEEIAREARLAGELTR